MKTAMSQRTNESVYLEFVNEWLTVEAMADNYGRTVNCMQKIINKGKKEHEAKVVKTGEQTQDFFSNVVNGTKGQSEIPYKIDTFYLGETNRVLAEIVLSMAGNFDNHIFKSIPTYFENLVKKAYAIAECDAKKNVLDIGASENLLLRLVNRIYTSRQITGVSTLTAIDANLEMYRAANNVSYPTQYICAPYLYDFEGKPAYNFGSEKFDIINCSMFFQFINSDRNFQVSETKKLLSKDGVLIIDEKCFELTDSWKRNEQLKDSYKLQYFTADALQEKSDTVLKGMHENMLSWSELRNVLNHNFKYVAEYWNAFNFHGFICSDNLNEVRQLMQKFE